MITEYECFILGERVGGRAAGHLRRLSTRVNSILPIRNLHAQTKRNTDDDHNDTTAAQLRARVAALPKWRRAFGEAALACVLLPR